MSKYEIEIQETTIYCFAIEANSEDEADDKAWELYSGKNKKDYMYTQDAQTLSLWKVDEEV